MGWQPPSLDEAREILRDAPKECQIEPALYDRLREGVESGRIDWMTLNEFGELVMGGELSVDGDIIPIQRWTRGSES